MNKSTNVSLEYYKQRLDSYLDMDGITELVINRPYDVFCEIKGEWQYFNDQSIDFLFCQSISTALAQYNGDIISDTKPLLSATMPTGERVQVVFPPACERDTISITIRKPSTTQIKAKSYEENSFYSNVIQEVKANPKEQDLINLYTQKNIPEFMYLAVEMGKTIVFAGGTGSGKTTYMKSLIDFIPLDTRIITIEDTSEIRFFQHKNYVHLYYPSQSGKDKNAIVTSGDLLISCFRMKPDAILLAEVRGAEAWDFMKAVTSGHSGMTSLHAGNCKEAVTAMIEKCSEHYANANTSREALKQRVLNSIDIICHIEANHGVRRMGEIYFKNVDKERFMRDESI